MGGATEKRTGDAAGRRRHRFSPWCRRDGFLVAAAVLGVLLPAVSRAGGPPVRLAAGGEARLPVVVPPGACETVRATAADLADYLGRMAGAVFEVREADGATGIALGVFSELPLGGAAGLFDPGDPLRREEYLLRSHPRGVLLAGATAPAVENAVWDFLGRLGYRQFFPGETWEVVPRLDEITVSLDAFEKPAFYARRIWYGHGVRPERREGYRQWLVRNRVRRGFALYSGHAYGGIIRANAEAFRESPDFYALVDGERRLAGRVDGGGNIKFCISNPGLRKLVVGHAVRAMTGNPERDSLSMDPSDGGNWCECEPCAAMGPVSDRVLILANEVAAAINDLGLGARYVGIYAYGHHSPPPSVSVHPRVIVSATAGFLRGGYTLDDVITGWQARGAVMGIYDYFSVMPWDWDLPGRPRASGPGYMAETIPRFHAMGIRFHDAESSDNWGPCGLGYYAAARILWDLEEAERVEEIRADFLARAFGPAAGPAGEFYRLIDRESRPLLSTDLIGRMYRALQEALVAAGDDGAIRARLLDLALYTRYVELWFSGTMDERVRHAHRIRDTGMVHFRALWARQRRAMELERVPAEWAGEGNYTGAETLAFIEAGIANNEIFEFTPVSYSEELVPASRLGLPEVERGTMGTVYQRHGVQGGYDLFTWFDEPGALELKVTGGLIPHFRDRGNVRLSLYSPREVTLEAVAFDDSVPPDGEERPVVLRTPYDGLHRLELRDGGDASRLSWPGGRPLTVPCAPGSRRLPLRGPWVMYFYVPGGTGTVAGFTDNGAGRLLDGDGNEVLAFRDIRVPGHFAVPVPAGQDGRLWRIDRHQGRRLQLLTVPPYLARCGRELLLPAEVVTADAGN